MNIDDRVTIIKWLVEMTNKAELVFMRMDDERLEEEYDRFMAMPDEQ